MHYVWMFIVGIIVGAIARLVMPGVDHMSLIMTGVLGIVGSSWADSSFASSARVRPRDPPRFSLPVS
jgi:uncharacterized membrane protein YeaQ/YmgE (transglycosylase-associated protein family)